MREILSGDSDIEYVKKFLIALKNKGETSEEVGALVSEMYSHSGPIHIADRAVDTVGTGGDGAHTINISTTAAIIAAAFGFAGFARGPKILKTVGTPSSFRAGAANLIAG